MKKHRRCSATQWTGGPRQCTHRAVRFSRFCRFHLPCTWRNLNAENDPAPWRPWPGALEEVAVVRSTEAFPALNPAEVAP